MAIASATRQRSDHLKEIKWNFRHAIRVICTFNVRFKTKYMRLGIYYEHIPYLGPKHYQLWTKLFFFSNQNNDIRIYLIRKYGDCYIFCCQKNPKNIKIEKCFYWIKNLLFSKKLKSKSLIEIKNVSCVIMSYQTSLIFNWQL